MLRLDGFQLDSNLFIRVNIRPEVNVAEGARADPPPKSPFAADPKVCSVRHGEGARGSVRRGEMRRCPTRSQGGTRLSKAEMNARKYKYKNSRRATTKDGAGGEDDAGTVQFARSIDQTGDVDGARPPRPGQALRGKHSANARAQRNLNGAAGRSAIGRDRPSRQWWVRAPLAAGQGASAMMTRAFFLSVLAQVPKNSLLAFCHMFPSSGP